MRVHFKKYRWKQISRKTCMNYQIVHRNKKHKKNRFITIHKIEFIIRNFPTRKFQAQMYTWAPRKLCRGVYSIVIYNSLQLETAWISINRKIKISRLSHTMETIQQWKQTTPTQSLDVLRNHDIKEPRQKNESILYK